MILIQRSTMMDFLVFMGIKLEHLFTGIIGGILSFSEYGKVGFFKAILIFTAGCAVAAYGTPPLVDLLGAHGSKWEHIIALLLGSSGWRILRGFTNLSKVWEKNPIELVTKLFKRGSN